jgi:hypothetical protein
MRHWRVVLFINDGLLHKCIYDFDLADGVFIGKIGSWFKIGNIYSIEAKKVVRWYKEDLGKEKAPNVCNHMD